MVYQDTDDVAEWVSVELLYETGASREIGIFAFYCDMPVTVQVQESNLLRKVFYSYSVFVNDFFPSTIADNIL